MSGESIEELLASGAVVPDRPGSKRLVPAAQSVVVVVPVEPTAAMLDNAIGTLVVSCPNDRQLARQFWSAMLAAAPAPPSLAQEGVDWFGVTGAADETEALAVALFDARCPGIRMTDEDLHYYRAAAQRAMQAVADELDTPALTPRHEAPASEGERERLRMAYKTGYAEGVEDSNGMFDRESCEEGWGQYAENISAQPALPARLPLPTVDDGRGGRRPINPQDDR